MNSSKLVLVERIVAVRDGQERARRESGGGSRIERVVVRDQRERRRFKNKDSIQMDRREREERTGGGVIRHGGGSISGFESVVWVIWGWVIVIVRDERLRGFYFVFCFLTFNIY